MKIVEGNQRLTLKIVKGTQGPRLKIVKETSGGKLLYRSVMTKWRRYLKGVSVHLLPPQIAE